MRPKNGRVERSQPKTRPAMSAPPAVDSVRGTPATFRTRAPISAPSVTAAPTNAMSATSLGRSGTPSTLAMAEVSWVRPTRVRMSPRLILVLGRMGMEVATAPRTIFDRKTLRAAGSPASSARVLPSTSLLVTYTSTPSTGTFSSSGSSTSCAASPITFTRTSRAPATATISPSRITVSAAASSMVPLARRIALHEDAGVRDQRFGLDGSESDSLPARPHPERAQLPSVPGRAGAAHGGGATLQLFVVLAGGDEVHADEGRADEGDHDGRAHGAEHVGHRVGDGHVVEQPLHLVGGQAEPVDGVGGEAHRRGDGLRA